MALPLTPRRTFGLYGLALALLFAVWLAVLSAGSQRWVVAKEGEPVRPAGEQVLDTDKPMREFYEELDGTRRPSRPTPARTPARRPAAALQTETAPPETVSPPPEPEEATEPSPPPATGPLWVVQVGAYTQRDQADSVLLRVQTQGLPARLVAPEPGGDRFFRVWVGGDFRAPEEAAALEAQLRELGIPFYTKKIR